MLRLLTTLLLIQSVFAATTSSRRVAEINASGNANNGAWFNPAGSNFLTDFATDTNTANTTAPVISSASYSFVAGDAGNWFFVKAGTNWDGASASYSGYGCWYPIASVATNKATLDASIGAGYCADITKGMPSPRFVATTTAGVSSSATVTGGTGGVDYMQVTGTVATGSDLTSANATTDPCVVSSATYTFRNIDVGNGLRISSGTNFTAGWYEIVSVSGGAATLDRACGSVAAASVGVFRFGGAFAFGGGNDDSFLESATATNGTGACRLFVKSGTHTPNGAINTASVGGNQAPIVLEGYNALRGDTPAGDNRPTVSFSTNSLVLGQSWFAYNLNITGTPATLVALGQNGGLVNSKVVNSSTTSGRIALQGAVDALTSGNELTSYRGYAWVGTATGQKIIGNYMHSSDVCIRSVSASFTNALVANNLLEDCASFGINHNAAITGASLYLNNTIAGSSTPRSGSVGVNLITGNTDHYFLNNIIWGWATGISHADSLQSATYPDYNDYFNNTTDRSNVAIGANDRALNPTFTSVGYITFSDGTTSGSVLTSASSNFAAVTDNQDYLYIVSGTGTTNTMFYKITAHTTTTLTLDVAPGTNATADKVGQIVTGRNYGIGTNLKALGFPGLFPGAITTSYLDIGGVQRQEPAGGGGTRIY